MISAETLTRLEPRVATHASAWRKYEAAAAAAMTAAAVTIFLPAVQ